MKTKKGGRASGTVIARAGESSAFRREVTVLSTDQRAQPQPFLLQALPLRLRKPTRSAAG